MMNTPKRLLSMLFMLVLSSFLPKDSSAQCPNTSRPGIHVVQAGETVYRIAKYYNLSIEDILSLNNMSYNDRLARCQELMVNRNTSAARSQPRPSVEINTNTNTNSNTSTSTSSKPSTPSSAFRLDRSRRQSGNRHTVRKGESMALLAQLYGYTEQRFREFNAMNYGEEPSPGSILYSTDCTCNRISFNTDPNIDRVGTIENEINNSGEWTRVDPGRNSTGSTPSGASSSPSSTRPSDSSGNTGSPAPNTTTSTTNTKTTMNREELSMIDEINLMRGNPAAYVQYVRDFVAAERARGGFPINQSTVEELIQELNDSPKLSILQPAECIYQAAKAHANDQRPLGDINHQGQDGSWPWDRVKKACPSMENGNENLVAGMSTVRGSVITLLIDEGISNRGHRKTLMNPEWTHSGCHNAGKIGMFPNYWVQKFGRAR